jgi:transposase-like protein
VRSHSGTVRYTRGTGGTLRITTAVRDKAVARIQAGETAAAVARELGVPSANVRKWVFRAGQKPWKQKPKTKPPKLSPVEPASHLEALRRQLGEVRANVQWCLDEGKASSLSGLQSLAARLESQIWAIEEARALERRRLEDDSDPAANLAAMIEDLSTLPRHVVRDIIDGLSAGLE